MPDKPDYDKREHPSRLPGRGSRREQRSAFFRPRYAELHCKSNFSFLQGASHPEELVERAAALGHEALAITDCNTLAGVVRMHCAARAMGIKLIVGAQITPGDAPPILLYAADRTGYGNLCRLITTGRLRCAKGSCDIHFDDVAKHHGGLLTAVVGQALPSYGEGDHGAIAWLGRYREIFGDRLYVMASRHYETRDDGHLADVDRWARSANVPMVAGNDVLYHVPARRFLQDVVTCVREKVTMRQAGHRLNANAERHLKPIEEMGHLFGGFPRALHRTVELARRCTFSLDELRYDYPVEICPQGMSPATYLRELTWSGARQRYPAGVPGKVRGLIEHELELIGQLSYEPYFLTIYDIVQYARSKDILCQGRGSAANSAVCYCIGITAVDPDRIDVLFERFVSAERNEPPDIDVDFEHERREEVFQYIYNKYGREHAGIVAEVITYRSKSAVRDVGKVLGLSLDCVGVLAQHHDWWVKEAVPSHLVAEAGLDPSDRTLRLLAKLVRQLVGFPRHLSQHVGGFVITRSPLCEMVPIHNGAMPDRTFIEWDKDDIDALNILKIDCLALGMLTAIRKCFGMMGEEGTPAQAGVPSSLSDIPPEDPAVYDMICRADTVGVFQIESRAQMSMLPRLRPRRFYDLVIEVAIVRPGPIQGDMVHPYLRRRNGEEPVGYPNDAIRSVLDKTLGVPLFQEQAMQLAVVAAGFTPGEADQLRRAMAAWRRHGAIDRFRTKLIEGMKSNGLSGEFAERCFKQICGFGEYGFPESHAASFALLVYVSAWLKRYHPAAFCAAIINSMPMGFYQPAQLVRDAIAHGVPVRAVDVNASGYDCRLEEGTEGPPPARGQARDEVTKGEERQQGNEATRQGGEVRSRVGRAHHGRRQKEGTQGRRNEGTEGEERQQEEGTPACATAGSGRRDGGTKQRAANPDGCGIFDFSSRGPATSQDGNTEQKQRRKTNLPPERWGVGGPAVRLGMRLIKGISHEQVRGIEQARRDEPFRSVFDLAHRSGAAKPTLARLAAADAMQSLGLNRREALWQVLALSNEPPLLEGLSPADDQPTLPPETLRETVIQDYQTLGLSLNAHPMSLIRKELARMRVQPARALQHARQGQYMKVAGIVLIRQRPGSALGVMFFTLEDETGVANLVIRPPVYERFRVAARAAVALIAEGRVTRESEVVHMQVSALHDVRTLLDELRSVSRDYR